MTRKTRLSAAAGAVVTALLLLTGCSGGSDSAVDAITGDTSTSVATTPTTVTASPSTPARVSANNATVAQLQQAFEAAGIPNASRWAREVDEYRPFPDAPNFPKLRQELAKYNPGPGVVDHIVATLTLP